MQQLDPVLSWLSQQEQTHLGYENSRRDQKQ